MSFPRLYWSQPQYRTTVESLSEYLELAAKLAATWPDRTFVWRGVRDADWALHSSLFRAASILEGKWLLESSSGAVAVPSLASYEARIVAEARRWGLQRSATDRLSALELLAALQHQGVPTRLLDFTHNAAVALWFAVEEERDEEGIPVADSSAGRVFIVQSNDRDIPEEWARDPDMPWTHDRPDDWLRDIYVWTPPPIDPRMTRQQGCFVFGGVPSTTGGWNVIDGSSSRPMRAGEIRSCVSVAVRLNSRTYLESSVARGRPPGYPLAFTVAVPRDRKADIRRELELGMGFTHRMMYPDYPGFAKFGTGIPRPSESRPIPPST